MKKIILVLVSIWLGDSAWASGCMNQYYLTVEKRQVMSKVSGADYKVISHSDKELRIELASGESVTLLSNQGRLQATSTPQNLYRVDAVFYEGSDCGPVFHCVTGQYLFTADPFEPKLASYSFPALSEGSGFDDQYEKWMAWQLIPTWSGLSLGESQMGVPKQCVLGDW